MTALKVISHVTHNVSTAYNYSALSYRISFCTADKTYEKIFGYIARNADNETMECHAFLSLKKKIVSEIHQERHHIAQYRRAESILVVWPNFISK